MSLVGVLGVGVFTRRVCNHEWDLLVKAYWFEGVSISSAAALDFSALSMSFGNCTYDFR